MFLFKFVINIFITTLTIEYHLNTDKNIINFLEDYNRYRAEIFAMTVEIHFVLHVTQKIIVTHKSVRIIVFN